MLFRRLLFPTQVSANFAQSQQKEDHDDRHLWIIWFRHFWDGISHDRWPDRGNTFLHALTTSQSLCNERLFYTFLYLEHFIFQLTPSSIIA